MATSIKTQAGREKLAKAHAGTATLPAVVKVALGSGGADAAGKAKELTGNETALFTKVIEKTAVQSFPTTTTSRYSISITPADNLAGTFINEACLIDSAGDVVAIKTFSNKGLDSDTTLEFDYDAIF